MVGLDVVVFVLRGGWCVKGEVSVREGCCGLCVVFGMSILEFKVSGLGFLFTFFRVCFCLGFLRFF